MATRKATLRANPNGFIAPVPDLRPGTDFESLDLPQTFQFPWMVRRTHSAPMLELRGGHKIPPA